MKRTLILLTILALALLVAPGVVLASEPVPSITPDSVEAVLFPGDSLTIEKYVQTPVIPPKIDIFLLQDETGSMGDDIGALKSLAPDIWDAIEATGTDFTMGVAGFRDFAVYPFGSPFDWVYRLTQDLTADKATFVAGVDLLTAQYGADIPEAQLEGLHYAATPGHPAIDSNQDGDTVDPNDTPEGLQPTWRDGATRVILLATDAPFHQFGEVPVWPGDADCTIANMITVLNGADITIIGLVPGGGIADVTALADGTGGSVQNTGSTGTEVADAILEGLSNLSVTVSMTSDAAYPLTTTFVPASQLVVSGEIAEFTETITVAADAPGGTYTARDWALIDDEPMTDGEGYVIYENKTIRVPEGFVTGGGQITEGKGKNALKVNYAGNVGFMADFSLVGQWQVKLHNVDNDDLDGGKFHSTEVVWLRFFNTADPHPEPPAANADVANFKLMGRFNGEDGWSMIWTILDSGEPGVDDRVAFTLWDPEDNMVYYQKDDFPYEVLTFDTMPADPDPSWFTNFTTRAAGNLQIHSGVKY